MKRKIIAIVISVVIVAGTGTAVGVVVKQNNDAKTEELVSVAVSEALATTETTTKNSTSESAATENTTTTESTTTEPAAVSITESATSTTVKKATKRTATASTQKTTSKPQTTTTSINPIHTPVGDVYKTEGNKHKDKVGYYWTTDYVFTPEEDPYGYGFYNYNIDENNQLFYHDSNGNRIYYKE